MDSTHVTSALDGPKPRLGLATERLRDQLAFSTNLFDNQLCFWPTSAIACCKITRTVLGHMLCFFLIQRSCFVMVERQDCAGFLAWSQCVNSLCQVAKVVRPTHLMSHLFARPPVMARPPFWEPSSLSLIGSSDNSTTSLLFFLVPRPSCWMRTSCHASSSGQYSN